MIAIIGPILIAISSYCAKVRGQVTQLLQLSIFASIMCNFLYKSFDHVLQATAGSAAREQMKYAVAGGIAEEVIVNIRTVAAFCKESFEMKR